MKYNQSCKTTGSIFNGAFSLRLAVDYPLNGAVAALVIRDKVRHVRMMPKLTEGCSNCIFDLHCDIFICLLRQRESAMTNCPLS